MLTPGGRISNHEVWESSTTISCGIGELARSSSFRNTLRRQREPLWIQNIRQQLGEQLKSLDFRLENHVSMLNELQDFYKKRSEVELEYSRNMDKLVKQIMTRHNDKQKRDTWPGYSTYTIWQTLLGTTRKMGKDHGVLGDLYNTQMSSRLLELSEDVQRVYKKCREMALRSHDELIKVLTELQSSMKTYHLYHGECLQAESKYRHVESQRAKIEQAGKGGGLTRKFRNFEKQSEKKQIKYMESKLKAIKARNEYVLCLEAANAAMRKYFVEDLQELINTMDYGYHSSLGRAVMMHISAENSMINSRQGCLDLINQRVRNLDQRVDKQTFLDLFNQPFLQPKEFEFQPHRGDEVSHLSAQKSVQEDLIDRLNTITERLNSLRVENDEVWKTLETMDNRLLEMVTRKDYDVSRQFLDECQAPTAPRSTLEREKLRSDRLETEEFYLSKFHDFQTTSNLIARLQAKYNCIEKALSETDCLVVQASRAPSVPPKPKRRKVLGKAPLVGQPRLFGGTIEEYVEATGEDVPLVVRSCVRILNLYGKHHQGLFRVPGSQHEINEFKNQFERGKDPLPDKVDGKDINSVAGVLKLYFRELQDPLFPSRLFDILIDYSTKYTFNNPDEVMESVAHIRHLLLTSLPQPVLIVMRYLFAFLNHLSEFSDENMMDPYNLSICFGPTLAPVPPDHDAHQFQSLANELIKNIIIHQEDIFPRDRGTLYEKCLAEVDGGPDESLDNLSEDEEINGETASEEDVFYDSDIKDAHALYDFQGRTERELSFKKGDSLILFEKVSSDWWEGAVADREGLIPDKYIQMGPRGEKDDCEGGKQREEEKRKSSESLPSKPPSHLVVKLSEAELTELSASHPNVSLGAQSIARPLSSASSSSSSRYDEDIGSLCIPDDVVDISEAPGTAAAPILEKCSTSSLIDDENKTPEDLAQDIDNALAEVMSGIKSLGLQHHMELETALMKSSCTEFKHTPDLVIDLPVNFVQPPSPKSATANEESPTLTTAEVFANANQCTIKKGTSVTPQATDPSAKSLTLSKTSDMNNEMKEADKASSVACELLKEEIEMKSNLTDVLIESGSTSSTTDVAPFHHQHPLHHHHQQQQQQHHQPVHRPTLDRQQQQQPTAPISPPPRTSSKAIAERISATTWATYATDINLEMEFVRSIIPPFEALSAAPSSSVSSAQRHSYSPRAEPVSCPSPRSSSSSSHESTQIAPAAAVNLPPGESIVLLPSSSHSSSAECREVQKPPIKAKPPIMKKPVRSNELIKRMQSSPEHHQHSDVRPPLT